MPYLLSEGSVGGGQWELFNTQQTGRTTRDLKKGQRKGLRLKRKGLWEIGGDSVLNFDLVAAFLAVIDLTPMCSLGI